MIKNRSHSEMSNYLPMYVYNNIKKVTEPQLKSSETFEKRLNEYKLKVAKENQLREDMINELLSENERITGWRRRSFDERTYFQQQQQQQKFKNIHPMMVFLLYQNYHLVKKY